MDELAALSELRCDARVATTARADARRGLVDAISRRRTRRGGVVALALGAALLVVAGTAYALGMRVLAGDPAPESVKNEARLLNEVKGELIPRARTGPRIRVEETRAAAVLDASTGPVYLWVAPTESGGRCLFRQIVGTEQPDGAPNLAGGCQSGTTLLDSNLSGTRVRNSRWLVLVYGHARAPVTRVEVRLERGRRLAASLTGGYFLVEIPGLRDSEIPTLDVVGLAANGRVLVRRKHAPSAGLAQQPVDIAREIAGRTPVLEILTRRTRKSIRIYEFERDGQRCIALESPGGISSGCGNRPPGPREIPIRPNQIGSGPRGMLLVWGEVGRDIASLELRFEDGRVEKLPLVRQFTLYQIDRADFASGRRPIGLIGRSSSGAVVARQAFGPWR